MDVKDILEFNNYLGELFEDETIYALGGYPALVAQGILPKERESKDIDICIYNNNSFKSEMNYDIGENLSYHIEDNLQFWNSYFKIIGIDRTYYHKITYSSISHEKLDLSNNQKDKLYNNLGINKSISISFRNGSFKNTNKKGLMPPTRGPIDQIEDNKITMNIPYMTASGSIVEKQFSFNKEELLNEIEEEKRKSEEMLNELKSKYKLQGALIFDYLMQNNDQGELNFDIFVSSLDRLGKNTVVIDENRYVHYYVILKAKYEYCMNETTNEEQFNKHIKDLAISYNKVHIKGINTPNDIEMLHLKRLKVNDK